MLIIAFGDSLTVGYQSPTPEHPMGQTTPYGRFLQNLLGKDAQVKIRGINGELTHEMLLRLDRDVISRGPDDVIILGGTNDLGWGKPPGEIMANLESMYGRVMQAGIRPVAVTVPSIRGFDALIPPRRELNRMILDLCGRESIPAVDLFTATAEPQSLRLAEIYSNDGLHLTTAGYRLLAELLHKNVYQPPAPQTQSARPSA